MANLGEMLKDLVLLIMSVMSILIDSINSEQVWRPKGVKVVPDGIGGKSS